VRFRPGPGSAKRAIEELQRALHQNTSSPSAVESPRTLSSTDDSSLQSERQAVGWKDKGVNLQGAQQGLYSGEQSRHALHDERDIYQGANSMRVSASTTAATFTLVQQVGTNRSSHTDWDYPDKSTLVNSVDIYDALQTDNTQNMTDGRAPIPQQPSGMAEFVPMLNMDAEVSQVGGPFHDLIWPGWPPHLPTPAIVGHL
jgi:hypothetical protein